MVCTGSRADRHGRVGSFPLHPRPKETGQRRLHASLGRSFFPTIRYSIHKHNCSPKTTTNAKCYNFLETVKFKSKLSVDSPGRQPFSKMSNRQIQPFLSQ